MIPDYENIEDIKRMQQEAVKRVQEMQKKAKISLEYSNSGIHNQKENIRGILPPKKVPNTFSIENSHKNENIKQNTLESLIKDPQKSLILLLILLLYDEQTDLMLILALFYIML